MGVAGGATTTEATAAGLVAVVVLSYRGLEDTLKCLDSLRRVRDPHWRVYLVENGTQPSPVAEIRAAHDWIEIIRCEENGGWSGGNNVGIRRALADGAEAVLLLNNDTIVAENLLERLRGAAAAHPEYGILGPVICWMDEPQQVNTDGWVFNDPAGGGFFQRRAVPWQVTQPPHVVETELVNGCAMWIQSTTLAHVGLIDERFFLIHEESEFCLRARRKGWRCGIVSEPLVWHKGSSAFARDSRPLQRYFDARNLGLLVRQHVGDPVLGAGRWRIRLQYWKHVYWMYAHERQAGRTAGADAVLNGCTDALTGVGGPLRDRVRPLKWLVKLLFSTKFHISDGNKAR
ncbi:MAG: glycosyltransferase family 2 protein [Planctomycetota bacterium]